MRNKDMMENRGTAAEKQFDTRRYAALFYLSVEVAFVEIAF